MKFRSSAVILCSLLAISPWTALAQNPTTQGGDFRGARWGQNPQEIEKQEAATPCHQDKQLVVFHDEFQGTPTEVIYFFVKGKLVMGFTHLLATYKDLNEYFTAYDQVKETLVHDLGTPSAENWQMSLPELESDRSLWADALGFGLIKVESGWLSGKTGIALRLSGENLNGHLMTIYFSRADMNAGRIAFKEYYAQNAGVPNEYFQE